MALWAAALLLATVLAYLPVLRAGFIWDDDAHVTENSTLRTLDGLRRIWLEPDALPQYYPLVHSTFWIERRLWGLNPVGFHTVNVLLHALNALLLWKILRRLAVPGAWLAAAIFALHPVHVESVAWVTERKNLLSGLFYLMAALALMRFFRLGAAGDDGAAQGGPDRGWGWYAAGFLLYLCALLAKTVTFSLPIAVLVVLWWKRDRLRWRDAAPLAPMLVAGAALGYVTVWIEKHHVGAEGEIWALPFLGRCLVAGRALWFYAWKLLWPEKLIFFYPRWEIDASAWWQWIFPVAAFGTFLALWALRRRIGKGPLAAVCFFAITLTPALGFFDVFPMRYSWVADHFQYLASAGLIALLAASLAGGALAMSEPGLDPTGLRRRAQTPSGRIAAGVRPAAPGGRKGVVRGGAWLPLAAGCLLAVLGSLTWRQCLVYKDSETLWRDTIAKDPASWAAHNNLGIILARRGEPLEAAAQYASALRLNPVFIEAHNNLGTVLYRQGKTEEAGVQFAEAVRLKPDYIIARLNLANVLIRAGRGPEAIEQLEAALRLQPDLIPAHEKLEIALTQEGRAQEALAAHAETLRLKAWVRATHESDAMRSGKEALDLAMQACELTGYAKPRPLDALGAAYAEAGRFGEAVESARKAISLAEASGQEEFAREIRVRIAAYEAGRPWRDASISRTYGG